MPLSVNFVLDTISDYLGKGKFGAFITRTFDSPLTIVMYQAHFAGRAQPMDQFLPRPGPAVARSSTDSDRYLMPEFLLIAEEIAFAVKILNVYLKVLGRGSHTGIRQSRQLGTAVYSKHGTKCG
jgi:hypothetical protein